jgi:pyruvate-ferredoxin/flavodoxin oxidoreductase
VYDPKELASAPASFKSTDARAPEWKGMKWTLQVAAEDCTGCALCVEVCPARNKTEAKLKAINMRPQAPLRLAERENWEFFLRLPELDRRKIKLTTLRQQQVMRPLFEFSGACAGCGETPYLKLATQLFGDRMIIANATGCSSIYGGNLPTTPYAVNNEGRGRPGATVCSRTTRSSGWASGSRLTSSASWPANCCRSWRGKSGRTWSAAC